MRASSGAVSTAERYVRAAISEALDDEEYMKLRMEHALAYPRDDLGRAARLMLYSKVADDLSSGLPYHAARLLHLPAGSELDEEALGRKIESILVSVNLTRTMALSDQYDPGTYLEDYWHAPVTDFSIAFYAVKYGHVDVPALVAECMTAKAARSAASLARLAYDSDSSLGTE